jgi:hypothetical protein
MECDQNGVDVPGRPLHAAPQGSPIFDRTERTYDAGIGLVIEGRVLDNLET